MICPSESLNFGHAALLPDGVELSLDTAFEERLRKGGLFVVARTLRELTNEDLDAMYDASKDQPYHQPMKQALLRRRGTNQTEPPRVMSFIVAGEGDVAAKLKELKGKASDPYGQSFRGDYSGRYLLDGADATIYDELIAGTITPDDTGYAVAKEIEQVVRREERLHTSTQESTPQTILALHPADQIEEAVQRFPGLEVLLATSN